MIAHLHFVACACTKVWTSLEMHFHVDIYLYLSRVDQRVAIENSYSTRVQSNPRTIAHHDSTCYISLYT